MFRKLTLIGISVLLLILAGSVANTQAQMSQQPEQIPPVGPITQGQAVNIAMTVTLSWGEQNAHLASVRKQLRDDFIRQLKAQGDDVLLAGTGDVWIVDLDGKFTPNRVPDGIVLQCSAMFVVVDIDSGDVISVGCR